MSEHPRLQALPGGRVDAARAPRLEAVPEPIRREEPTSSGTAEPRRALRQVPPSRTVREPLWREVLGERLRSLRQEHGEKLAETAARAGISPQYLSEVERGRKEPSSEMIAALAGALGTDLGGLIEQVAGELRRQRMAASLSVAVPRLEGMPVLMALAA